MIGTNRERERERERERIMENIVYSTTWWGKWFWWWICHKTIIFANRSTFAESSTSEVFKLINHQNTSAPSSQLPRFWRHSEILLVQHLTYTRSITLLNNVLLPKSNVNLNIKVWGCAAIRKINCTDLHNIKKCSIKITCLCKYTKF